MAAQLCIPKELLEKTVGFEDFAVNNHLVNCLVVFKHVIKVCEDEIYINVNGVFKKWLEVYSNGSKRNWFSFTGM